MPKIEYAGDNVDENNSFTEDYDEQYDSGLVSFF
jgi:hypothetical protein